MQAFAVRFLWNQDTTINNQLKWKQRLHHLFPLRALLLLQLLLLLHKLRAFKCLKEDTLRYQVNISTAANPIGFREMMSTMHAYDLGGVSHCLVALPWQLYETYLSGCLCFALITNTHT